MKGRAISTPKFDPTRTPTLAAIRAPEVSRVFGSAVQGLEHDFELVDKTAAADGPLGTAGRHCCELRRNLRDREVAGQFNPRVLVNRMYKTVEVNAEYGGNWWARYEDWRRLHFTLKSEQQATVVRPGAWKVLFFDGEGPWTGRSCAVAYLLRVWALHSLMSGDRVAELLQGGRGAGQ